MIALIFGLSITVQILCLIPVLIDIRVGNKKSNDKSKDFLDSLKGGK